MKDAACYALIDLSPDPRRAQIVLVQDNDKNTARRPGFKAMWKLPGGKFDPAEGDKAHEDAVRREVVEEIGLDVTLGELVHEDTLTSRRNDSSWLFKVWRATAIPPVPAELRCGSEIARIKLFTGEDIAWEANGGILPNHLAAINKYAAQCNWWR